MTNENLQITPDDTPEAQVSDNSTEYVVQENTELSVINTENYNEYHTYYNILSIENAQDTHIKIHKLIISNADEFLLFEKDKHKGKIEKNNQIVMNFYDKLISNVNTEEEFNKYLSLCLKASQDYLKYANCKHHPFKKINRPTVKSILSFLDLVKEIIEIINQIRNK